MGMLTVMLTYLSRLRIWHSSNQLYSVLKVVLKFSIYRVKRDTRRLTENDQSLHFENNVM